MKLSRRRALQSVAGALLFPASALGQMRMPAPAGERRTSSGGADHSLLIGTAAIAIGKDTAVSTRVYNSQFPGPLLRLTQGKRVTIDIRNDTDTPEQVHWHGQFLDTTVDGSSEEGTPFIQPHSSRRISFVPGPSGFRYYHTHLTAGTDLSLGLYNGLAGAVYIEPRGNTGA